MSRSKVCEHPTHSAPTPTRCASGAIAVTFGACGSPSQSACWLCRSCARRSCSSPRRRARPPRRRSGNVEISAASWPSTSPRVVSVVSRPVVWCASGASVRREGAETAACAACSVAIAIPDMRPATFAARAQEAVLSAGRPPAEPLTPLRMHEVPHRHRASTRVALVDAAEDAERRPYTRNSQLRCTRAPRAPPLGSPCVRCTYRADRLPAWS